MSDIDLAMSEIDAHISRVVRKTALQALSGVVTKTPVKSGRAKGNWQVGLNIRPNGDLERLDASGETVIAEGSAKIAEAQPYGQVYVVNNVPYIGRLEDGSSTQAPNGMVAVTVASIEAAAKRLAKG